MKISFDVEFEIKFSFEHWSVNVAMKNLNCCLRTVSRLTDDALGQKIRLLLIRDIAFLLCSTDIRILVPFDGVPTMVDVPNSCFERHTSVAVVCALPLSPKCVSCGQQPLFTD